MDIYFQAQKLIIEHIDADILKRDLLSSYDFSQLINRFDIGFLSEKNIQDLWMTKILNADVVQSIGSPLQVDGLNFVKQENNEFFYIDQRVIADNYIFGSGLHSFSYENSNVKLYFHRFRLFSILYILNIAKYNFDTLQFLIYQDGVKKIIDLENTHDKNTPRFHTSFVKENLSRNNTIALSVISKLYQNIPDIIELFKNISVEEIEAIRKKICLISEDLDGNPYLHLLIRLMNDDFRRDLKGNIGASMVLFDMAESIRRAIERTHDVKLPEEIENGFSFWTKGYKQKYYSRERLYDDSSIAKEIFKLIGADYSIKIRCYVEGETEQSIVQSILSGATSIEVINLKGKMSSSKKIFDIRDFLKRDMEDKIFSVVIVDNDREDVKRTLKQSCKNNEFFGQIFYSDPDFEFENFTKVELEQIISNYAGKEGALDTEIDSFKQLLKSIDNAKALEKLVRDSFKVLNNFGKGEDWGKHLAKYVNENPNKINSNEPRKITKAIDFINKVLSEELTYIYATQHFRVSETGEFINLYQ